MAHDPKLFEGDWRLLIGEQDFDDPAIARLTLTDGEVLEAKLPIGTYDIQADRLTIRVSRDGHDETMEFGTMIGEDGRSAAMTANTPALSGMARYATVEAADGDVEAPDVISDPATLYRAEALAMLLEDVAS